MAKTGKRLTKSYDNFDRDSFYEVDQAVTIAKENATAKFDESIEIAMNLGVDPRHADQMVRGVVALPHGTGKSVRVAEPSHARTHACAHTHTHTMHFWVKIQLLLIDIIPTSGNLFEVQDMHHVCR